MPRGGGDDGVAIHQVKISARELKVIGIGDRLCRDAFYGVNVAVLIFSVLLLAGAQSTSAP
jgi:hypothetical protein